MSGNELIPLEKPLTASYIQQAIADKETVKENGEDATLAVPIRLRGDVIGVIDIRVTEEHEWEQDEVDITEAIAERLSLALDLPCYSNPPNDARRSSALQPTSRARSVRPHNLTPSCAPPRRNLAACLAAQRFWCKFKMRLQNRIKIYEKSNVEQNILKRVFL